MYEANLYLQLSLYQMQISEPEMFFYCAPDIYIVISFASGMHVL
jgi:hypothetical protein